MKKIITLLSLCAASTAANAGSALQLSLTPNIALHNTREKISGLSLNIWGKNQVNGIDFGFVNGLRGKSSGISLSYLGTYGEDYKGVIWAGFYANTSGEVSGWQAAMLNINSDELTGLQSGWVNIGNEITGVQLGLVNYTKELHGVQVGLLNWVDDNEWFTELPNELSKGFPFVNWSF